AIVMATFSFVTSQKTSNSLDTFPYNIYPEVNSQKPDLFSPGILPDGNEYVVAITHDQQYAIIPVTLTI
ncbi:MAG: hypothetical protein HKN68_11800, partial [Saprospiraceae bacterium]|nr:hypothetical protein [Saprospiraceae bacterium]